jgi:tRNA 5-methylaminomethyl-2-thiouridine biosynthesis bifunctional protein
VIAPPRLVDALLDAPLIQVAQAAVAGVAQRGGAWHVLGTRGELLASAPVVIVAVALDTPRLVGASMLPVQAIPGQVTFIRAPELTGLRAGLGGDGTLLRAPDGRLAVGATYEAPLGGTPVALDERAAARSNLARLERLLAVPVVARVDDRYAGVRCVARDRLPYIGGAADEAAAQDADAALRGAHLDDLPRRTGLHVSFAHGSRGLTFAALAGELIAAQLEGEPLPVERALAEAVDPGRVLLRRLRRGAAGLRTDAPSR